jgi:hypothetical protein
MPSKLHLSGVMVMEERARSTLQGRQPLVEIHGLRGEFDAQANGKNPLACSHPN